MAKDILREAIAEAKAVREVALANSKAALEEAFTPKLQSMLSAKLSEELNEAEDEDIEENVAEETTIDEIDDIDEMVGFEDKDELDEEIDLEEILNELELEEGDEAEEDTIDELNSPMQSHDKVANVLDTADQVYEGENFDLDALLEEINNLEEQTDSEMKEQTDDEMGGMYAGSSHHKKDGVNEVVGSVIAGALAILATAKGIEALETKSSDPDWSAKYPRFKKAFDVLQNIGSGAAGAKRNETTELYETKKALKTVRDELNEVNLLNSKLLYVNRIFKANTLDDVQKLRVVETLDKAESAKEAKLIYETIKDTFTISKGKKVNPKRSIREGLGMASRAAGNSTAPTKAILKESNDMVARMQKLANITIKQ